MHCLVLTLAKPCEVGIVIFILKIQSRQWEESWAWKATETEPGFRPKDMDMGQTPKCYLSSPS